MIIFDKVYMRAVQVEIDTFHGNEADQTFLIFMNRHGLMTATLVFHLYKGPVSMVQRLFTNDHL